MWQKLDSPATSHDMVEVKVDYGEGTLEISPFLNPWISSLKTPPFCGIHGPCLVQRNALFLHGNVD